MNNGKFSFNLFTKIIMEIIKLLELQSQISRQIREDKKVFMEELCDEAISYWFVDWEDFIDNVEPNDWKDNAIRDQWYLRGLEVALWILALNYN